MPALHGLVHRVGELQFLDRVTDPLTKTVGQLVRPRLVKNLLSGTNIGHPLHPMLTDVPIGAWTMSTLLDTVGGRSAEPAADLLVATGIVAAVPTAASGLSDWSDTYGPETRIGLVHAAANTVALSLFASSLAARLTGRRGAGRLLGRFGVMVLLAGGYTGGHLGYVRGVNVNHTAWHEGPTEWTQVLADGDLTDGQTRRVEAAGTPILLHRAGGVVWALDSVCSHAGGPLDEGTVSNGCVTCPWHGSVFRLEDGSIHRGPASTPQPSYETRLREGQIEVRARG